MKTMSWNDLGIWLEAAARGAELGLRDRVVSEVEARLRSFSGPTAELADVVRGSFDASAALLADPEAGSELAARRAAAGFWKTIEVNDDPEQPSEELEKWSGFRELLTERLSEIREAGIEHAERAAGLPKRLAELSDEVGDIWPLRPGSLGEPEPISLAVRETARWIAIRSGWARVLFDLAPILAAADLRRRN